MACHREESNKMNIIIDQLQQLQSLYYILSRSRDFNVEVRSILFNSLRDAWNRKSELLPVLFDELPEVERFREISVLPEVSTIVTNRDVSTLVAMVIKTISQELDYSIEIEEILDVESDSLGVFKLVPALIDYLQSIGLEMSSRSHSIVKVDIGPSIERYDKYLDDFQTLSAHLLYVNGNPKYFTKLGIENILNGMKEIYGTVDVLVDNFDELRENLLKDRPSLLPKNTINIMDTSLVGLSYCVGAIEEQFVGLEWLKKAIQLRKYHNLSSTIDGGDTLGVKEFVDSINYRLFELAPDGDIELEVVNEIEPILSKDYEYRGRSEITHIGRELFIETLADVQYLTWSILDPPAGKNILLINDVIIRIFTKDVLYLLNPLLNYYSKLEYNTGSSEVGETSLRFDRLDEKYSILKSLVPRLERIQFEDEEEFFDSYHSLGSGTSSLDLERLVEDVDNLISRAETALQ